MDLNKLLDDTLTHIKDFKTATEVVKVFRSHGWEPKELRFCVVCGNPCKDPAIKTDYCSIECISEDLPF